MQLVVTNANTSNNNLIFWGMMLYFTNTPLTKTLSFDWIQVVVGYTGVMFQIP